MSATVFLRITTSILTVFLHNAKSKDICHEDQYIALRSKDINEPWFHYIAKATLYDEQWPQFSSTNGESSAYASISSFLTTSAGLDYPTTSNIRDIYGSFDVSDLGTIQTYLAPTSTTALEGDRPTDCDTTCWGAVKAQLLTEADQLKNVANFIEDIMTPFLVDKKNAFFDVVSMIEGKLKYSPEYAAVVQENSGSDSIDTAFSVINAFAGLFAAFDGSAAIQMSAWILSSTQTFGGSIIDGSNNGYSRVTVNLNNKLWIKTSDFQKEITAKFHSEMKQMEQDQHAIMSNYGKLQKYKECMTLANAQRETKDGIEWETVYTEALAVAYKWMQLTTYAVLMPSKYIFWAQFSCENNMEEGSCQCSSNGKCYCKDDGCDCDSELLDKGKHPACSYESAEALARSKARSLSDGSGSIVGFLGVDGDDDPGAAMSKDAISYFNDLLKSVVGDDKYVEDFSLQYILDHIDISKATSKSFPDSVSVELLPTLSFSFKASMQSNWCRYRCYAYYSTIHKVWWCSNLAAENELKSCNLCVHCESKCGYSCGSCLSSTTNVLMANNEYKAISEIKVGDDVMNPVTGSAQTVKAVATPLRNRRELYSINGADFKFTRAHPFGVYDNSSLQSIVAVDTDDLLFYVPTIDEEMVDTMNVNGSLSLYYHGEVFDYEKIENIERFDFDETSDTDGEVLYDLVFDLTAPSAYVVNDGIVVHNEWYDFAKYPKTTHIVLNLLDKLVKTEENNVLRELSMTKEKNRDSLNDIATFIADYKLSFYDIINTHIDVELSMYDNTTECQDFVLDVSKVDAINSIYNDNLWAIRRATEEFIATVTPKLNYVFHSEKNQDIDEICFENVAPLLIDALVSGLTDAMSTDAPQTTDAPRSTEVIVNDTQSVDDDASVTYSIAVCVVVGIFVVAFR